MVFQNSQPKYFFLVLFEMNCQKKQSFWEHVISVKSVGMAKSWPKYTSDMQ